MNNVMTRFAGLALIFWLIVFLSQSVQAQEQDTFPGGSDYYNFGISQSKENFANISRAQSHYSLRHEEWYWSNLGAGVGVQIPELQNYRKLYVRWELRDGRQFLAEDIDMRLIMNEYLKSHDIKLPWQKEGRSRAKFGDADPLLAYEIEGDNVIVKWRITTNHTPVDERFTSAGIATHWRLTHEEFIVATLKGKPTSGMDFRPRYRYEGALR